MKSIIVTVFLILLALLSCSVYPVRSLEVVYSLRNILSEGLEYRTSNGVYASVQEASTNSGCGNGVVEPGEQCDGIDLGEETCAGLGYSGGTLSCNTDCTFNTSNCTSGGGGGGGGGYVSPTVTKVIIQGKAYPLSSVTVLKDSKIVTTTIADSQANFKVEITDITAGTWTFGVWAEDKDQRKSITFSFTTSVTRGMTTTISGIFLPPTIDLSKIVLQRGETLNILGQTAPESDISIFINSPEVVKKTQAEADGTWFYGFDTTILEEGSHTTRAKATSSEGSLSSYSKVLGFHIGEGAIVAIEKADVTEDGKVNLIDFSILLYNWGIPENSSVDFNNDGKVNLVDFSIMMYYWTG